MKRLLIFILLLLCLVQIGSCDYTENFQLYSVGEWVIWTTGSGSSGYSFPYAIGELVQLYMYVTGATASSINAQWGPFSTNYYAWSVISAGHNGFYNTRVIYLLKSDLTVLGSFDISGTETVGKWEIIRDSSSGVTRIWINGAPSALAPQTFATAPVYIQFSHTAWIGGGYLAYYNIDNFHAGTADPKYWSSTIPPNWSVVKDFINPALSGLYANSTLIRTTYMDSVWSRGNGTTIGTVSLKNYLTGQSFETLGVGTSVTFTGTVRNNLSVLTNASSSAPFGLYELTMDSGSGSDNHAYFLLIGNGAYVAWDHDTYTQNDVAHITYTITPAYWDTATYDYYLRVLDQGLVTKYSTPIVATTDTKTLTLDDSYEDGDVYYATVYAVKKSDASEILMNYNYMEMDYDTILTGYCFNATNGSVMGGVNVSTLQGSIYSFNNSNAVGLYRIAGLTNSVSTHVNGSLNFFNNASYLFTPLEAKTYNVNLSLVPHNLSYTNASIGGIVYSTSYHQPIEGATVRIMNETHYSLQLSSLTGWYNFTGLLDNTEYWIQATKSGYALGANTSVFANILTPITSFISDVIAGASPLPVQFNDTSLHFPTSWCWTYTNVTGNNTPVYWSQIQNATETFGLGNWSIALNASNSNGFNSWPTPGFYWINVT